MYFQSKLVKLFSSQLVAKRRLQGPEMPECLNTYPKLGQWLAVVGLQRNTIQVRIYGF